MPSLVQEVVAAVAPGVVLALTVASFAAAGHAVLTKRDVRSAIAWVWFILLVPAVGAVAYALFGINRIRVRAAELRPRRLHPPPPHPVASIHPAPEHAPSQVRLVDEVSGRPRHPGNRVDPLDGGDRAYPAMLEAIAGARRSVLLQTYIFDHDPAGERFADALVDARRRGVEVRVLVDAVGARYSRRSMVAALVRRGVDARAFLPTLLPWRFPYANLRNHRKILVVDGEVGFTGGMNVRAGCWSALEPAHPVRDVHFRVEGPVVAELVDVFAEDWAFTTRRYLEGEAFFPPLRPRGDVVARVVPDGPDGDLYKLRWTLLGALAQAERSVHLVTPYFLPDEVLKSALVVAALRGVDVDIVLPARNNLRFIQWASTHDLYEVLEKGCRVWLSPPPFDHTKLFVVDRRWALVGSANWDPRSLRLNFELGLELTNAPLAERLDDLARSRRADATRYTLVDWYARPLPTKLGHGVARLFAPYL